MIDRTSLFKNISTFNFITINRNDDYKDRNAVRKSSVKNENPDVICVENTPIAGIQIDMFSLDRPTIIDPRGFKTTLTYDKFVYLMSYVTIDKSQILDECVYVSEPGKHQIIPVPVNSEAHHLAIKNSCDKKPKRTTLKNIPVGTVISFRNMEYEVVANNTRNIEPYYFTRSGHHRNKVFSLSYDSSSFSKKTASCRMSSPQTILRRIHDSRLLNFNSTCSGVILYNSPNPSNYTKEQLVEMCIENRFIPLCFGKNQKYPVYHAKPSPDKITITVNDTWNTYDIYMEMVS